MMTPYNAAGAAGMRVHGPRATAAAIAMALAAAASAAPPASPPARPPATRPALTVSPAGGASLARPSPAQPSPAQPSLAQASQPKMIQLNFPQNLQLKTLIDYVSQRMQMNIIYDESLVKKQVTMISPARIPEDSLPGLFQSILRMSGLALVDADQPGWKRIVAAQNFLTVTLAASRPVEATTQRLATAEATEIISQVFQLRHVTTAEIDKTVQPFLSKPGGNTFAIPARNMLIITDYADNLRLVSTLVGMMDQEYQKASITFLPVKHRDAGELSTQVTGLLSKKLGLSGEAKAALPGLVLAHEPRTNRIVMVHVPGAEKEAVELIESLDVPTGCETRSYQFQHVSPQRVDRLVRDLGLSEQAKLLYKSAIDAEGNILIATGPPEVHEGIAALQKKLDVPPETQTKTYRFRYLSPQRIDKLVRELMDHDAVKRPYKSTVDPEGGMLLVTADQSVHERIKSLTAELDVPQTDPETSYVRFYKLVNTTAAAVLATIRAMELGEGLPEGAIEQPAQAPASPSAQIGRESSEGTGPNVPPPGPGRELPKPPAYKEPESRPARTESAAMPAAGKGAGTLTAKTKDAKVTIDQNTNTIIVVAPPPVQRIYQQLITMLDRRRPQVIVEVIMVTLDTSANFSLGVELSKAGDAGDGKRYLTFSSFGLSTADLNTGALTLKPGIGFNGVLVGADTVNVVLRALETSGRSKVLSAPKVLINDNATATLSSVAEAPYTSVNASNTVATTSFAGYASAGTTVTLTPHISEGEHLQLHYSITLNSFTGQGSATVPPPRQTNTISSDVTVPGGEAVIVGGLTREDVSETVSAVPLLGKVPILEYLVGSRSETKSRSTLFVFLRPMILRDDQFEDLKYFSDRDLALARMPANLPASGPMIMR